MKSRNKSYAIKAALFTTIFLIYAAYTNCAGNGNRFTSVKEGSIFGNPMAPVSWQLLFAACGAVNRCNSAAAIGQCELAFLNASINTQVGASAGLSPFQSVM